MIKPESPSALSVSYLRPQSLASIITTPITAARTTEGANPHKYAYINMINVVNEKFKYLFALHSFRKPYIREIKKPTCKPLTVKIWMIPEFL